jgi:hypothetical protein
VWRSLPTGQPIPQVCAQIWDQDHQSCQGTTYLNIHWTMSNEALTPVSYQLTFMYVVWNPYIPGYKLSYLGMKLPYLHFMNWVWNFKPGWKTLDEKLTFLTFLFTPLVHPQAVIEIHIEQPGLLMKSCTYLFNENSGQFQTKAILLNKRPHQSIMVIKQT